MIPTYLLRFHKVAVFHHCYRLLVITTLLSAAACNTIRDNNLDRTTLQSSQQPAATPGAQQSNYDNFKTMSVEERWHSLSPARRNSLRQDPNRYPYFKNMIAAEPDMEEVPPNTPADPPPAIQAPAFSEAGYERTPEEWWNSFDESRKKYIREHPEEYPQFKPFLNKP